MSLYISMKTISQNLKKSYRTYILEAAASGIYVYLVYAAIAGEITIYIPMLEAFGFGLLVYLLYTKTGAHINPALTLGLWSTEKIDTVTAVLYVIAQTAGAAVAVMFAQIVFTNSVAIEVSNGSQVFIAETVGMTIFAFCMAAVLYKKLPESITGLVAASGLFIGMTIAILSGSDGILNPLVAAAIGSLNPLYFLSSLVGGVCGIWLYKLLCLD